MREEEGGGGGGGGGRGRREERWFGWLEVLLGEEGEEVLDVSESDDELESDFIMVGLYSSEEERSEKLEKGEGRRGAHGEKRELKRARTRALQGKRTRYEFGR